MDNDKQISLKFLDEAEGCCDQIESTVLGLANTISNSQELDHSLRAAHSIKGGAAMMGFMPLSQVAHQLEDFLKILRLRYHSNSIDMEVETLLLEGLDNLRLVIDLHRRGEPIDQTWLATNSQPIFVRLRQKLGDLRVEDEDRLLSQQQDVNAAILMFDSGVNESLDFLESQLANLSPAQLRPELIAMAEELSDFGRMAKLEQFVDLCESVKDQCQSVALSQVVPLTRQALKTWRKSHSLVLLGRFEKIPSQLPGLPSVQSLETSAESMELLHPISDDPGVFFEQEDLFNPDLVGLEELIDIGSVDLDLNLWQSEIVNHNIPTEEDFNFTFDEIPEFPTGDFFNQENWELSLELSSELANIELPEFPTEFISDEKDWELPLELGSELANIEIPDHDDQLTAPLTIAITPSANNSIAPDRQTVRVPVEYLQQFNTVFGQLILERNTINLRLAEIQNYMGLLRKRVQHLDSSNRELHQWYDAPPKTLPEQSETTEKLLAITAAENFDSLEMDRYSDLHLVSQDQIEMIVQLQEVTSDIELSLQEMTQSIRSLHQTTRTLQKNIVRTQMIPFADVSKRFPRLIRDLSVQFGKSVNLKILGENTEIDRSILENLSDPLIHLLRNAFDHGIEDSATRLAAGKPTEGNIILAASQRSGDTIITITDDGGGINFHRIRQQLQQMGLPADDVSEMSEAQLLDMIFEPGFSTATILSELSGRGVGMDVVRTNIEQIRGRIQVKTQPGVGTTFTISVPFSLSILRVMLLERAGFIFAVSIDSVREIINFQPDLVSENGMKISWQSQIIPLVSIEQGLNFGHNYRHFSLPGTPTISQPTVLIVGENQSSIAFHVDRFWGEQEVTLRPIDSPMPLTPGFGNSIILGDGRLLPLIDLMQFASWMSVTTINTTNSLAHLDSAKSIKSIATNAIAVSPQKSLETTLPAMSQQQSDTILVIDDSINVRRYLAMMLEKEGYQVEQARDGQEAVEQLCAGLVVQGVLCDIEMPRLDGYGVLDALRSNEIFVDLPIIMLTSRGSEKHRQLAMNLGASSYFTKPYSEPDLLVVLKSLIATAPRKLDC